MNSFQSQIVASTVLLVAAVMVALVLGTQLVLELGERHPEARSAWNILLATGLVGACGVVLSGWVAWRVSHRALKPVRDMAERAEDWSAQNLARRFDLGPPVNELSQLGQTLDHLHDRVALAIRAEQRLSAELAHEIRTPLAAIRGSAEQAARCLDRRLALPARQPRTEPGHHHELPVPGHDRRARDLPADQETRRYARGVGERG